ncbi:hypothetical protein ACFZBU_46505 [Embleya sp. NPDC008237]|uniref:effector-associated constant component EACC1 n=1 Tax=Embleya sp. NPDC008237 TaxID=3363978 RepID=UPI0036EC26BA
MGYFRVRVEGGVDGEPTGLTESFADWLIEDRAVGTHADIGRVRSAAAGDGGMSGEVVEWISFATSSGFSTAALVYAHRSFRASLPRRVRDGVRLVVERDGTTLVVEGVSADDAARIARVLGTADTDTAPPV